MVQVLQTVFAGTSTLALTGAFSPIVWLMALRSPRHADGAIHLWAKGVTLAAGVRSRAHHLERLPTGQACVFACNHQSHFDVLVLYRHLRTHLRFVAKKELFRIPLFGPALRRAGTVEVSRDGSQADRDAMMGAVDALHGGRSIIFFPEGTRSEDGVLRPFKKGAAILALRARVPIVPLAISGTRHILRKGSKSIRWGQQVALVVGEPLATEGFTLEQRDDLNAALSQRIAALYAEARGLSGDP